MQKRATSAAAAPLSSLLINGRPAWLRAVGGGVGDEGTERCDHRKRPEHGQLGKPTMCAKPRWPDNA